VASLRVFLPTAEGDIAAVHRNFTEFLVDDAGVLLQELQVPLSILFPRDVSSLESSHDLRRRNEALQLRELEALGFLDGNGENLADVSVRIEELCEFDRSRHRFTSLSILVRRSKKSSHRRLPFPVLHSPTLRRVPCRRRCPKPTSIFPFLLAEESPSRTENQD